MQGTEKTNITGYERARNALMGLPVDRVPIMLYRHFYIQDNDNSVEAYIKWARDTKVDILLVQVDGYDGLPVENKTGRLSDLLDYPTIDSTHPFIRGQVDRVARISSALKHEVAVFPVIYTPFNNIKKTLKYGFNNMYTLEDIWKSNPDVVSKLMRFAQECNDLLLQEYRNTNALGVMISFRNGGTNVFTSEQYRRILRPWDIHLLKMANAKFKTNIMHICGAYGMNDISLWSKYNISAVNWDTHIEVVPESEIPLTIDNARKVFKNTNALIAGFDNRPESVLYSNEETMIKDKVTEYLNQSNQLGFILGADCSVDECISAETFRWIREACEQYTEEN